MSYVKNFFISTNSGADLDAFGRFRVSEPFTVFDSKQIHDNQPLFWDDQEVSGGGTGSSWDGDRASTTLSVSASTAGNRTRQTFQRFNYQPGKGQLALMTFILGDAAAGVTKRVGLGDDNNGLFLCQDGDGLKVCRRTYVTGSAVDVAVNQADWNIDPLDGTGKSGITLDPTKAQILVIAFEWLGVGSVTFAFNIDGIYYPFHQLKNANNLTSVYMSTPNLPLRYEIENDGTGSAATLEAICCSVASEGGVQNTGILRHDDSGAISGLSTGTTYAVMGIRLQSGKLDGVVNIENISMLSSTANDQAHWELLFNPTIAGTFTYADFPNSVIQVAKGAASNTVTGGTAIDGGFFSTAQAAVSSVPNALRLGSKIDGTVDQIVLVARPVTNNITLEGSITWRELS